MRPDQYLQLVKSALERYVDNQGDAADLQSLALTVSGLSLLAAELHAISLLTPTLELETVKKIAQGDPISEVEIEARGFENVHRPRWLP